MKKMFTLLVLAFIVFNLIGCDASNTNPVNTTTEEPFKSKETSEATQIIDEIIKNDYYLRGFSIQLVRNQYTDEEILERIKLADKYNLDMSLPEPDTGQIYGELYVEDYQRFLSEKDEIIDEIEKKPFEERKNIPYRNYWDITKHGDDPTLPIIVSALAEKNFPKALREKYNVNEAYFYTIPELMRIEPFGSYMVKGVLVARWPENIDPEFCQEDLKGIKGDGNFYKHYTTLFFQDDGKTFTILSWGIEAKPGNEGFKKLGPDWKPESGSPK